MGVQNKDEKDMKQLSEKENIRFAVVAIALLIFSSANAIYVSTVPYTSPTEYTPNPVYIEYYSGYEVYYFNNGTFLGLGRDWQTGQLRHWVNGSVVKLFGCDLPDLRGDITEANR